ncbi:MAG: hypothetical protein AB7I30_22815 [Isosphaeraceae bacterium]
MAGLATVLSTIPWYAWIAIVAIVCSAASQTYRWRCRHAERMEMIRQGMNPDAVAGAEKAYTETEI